MNGFIPGSEMFIRLPWHALCSDNRKFLNRRFVLANRYRQSKALISRLAAETAREQQWTLTAAPLEIIALITPPDHRRRDLNFSKNLKDGITDSGAVWRDDSQVRRELWDMTRVPDRTRAGALIAIRLCTPFPDKPTTNQKERK